MKVFSSLLLILICLSTTKANEFANASIDQTDSKFLTQFLNDFCVSCHGQKKAEADLRLDKIDTNIATGNSIDKWNLIRLRLLTEEMPPSEAKQPSHGKSSQMISLLTRKLVAGEVELLNPPNVFLPTSGNKVDHQLLFSGKIKTPAATKSRIWRKSPQIYESLTKGELAKNIRGIAQPFSNLVGDNIKDYASAFTVDESTLSQLMRNAELIVANQMRGELKDGKWVAKGYPQPVREFTDLLLPENQPGSRELKNRAISKQFDLILKRKPTQAELDRYAKLIDKLVASAGSRKGVATALTAVLLTPEAIFRFEFGDGKVDKFGRQMLAPREIAFAIAYALSDKAPDQQLLRMAAEGKLQTKESIGKEIDRLFANPKIQKPRVLRLFREYFGYHRAKDVFKDKKLNPHHRADMLINDTDRLIEWILQRDKNVFEELLTTNRSFVNYAYDAKKKRSRVAQAKNLVHTSYGLPVDWKWTPHQPVELSKKERAGILTQPSWLVSHSGNFDNHPILRGKWIRERLLGGTIPDLPITVDAQLPEEPQHTLRHRMRVTRETYCWKCHQRMNPLGLAFESYDHFGRFRTAEQVLDEAATKNNVDKKGKSLGEIYKYVTLDASAKVADIDEKSVEGNFENAVEMIHHLAKTDRARQMFMRYVFRYFLGRNEELSDSSTLIAADRAYLESGGSFKTLVKNLLTSDSFLYRIKDNKRAD